MQDKYICIHGHFYQPPRENAWLEEVELQDSAAPFHDWNARINFECYAPNTAARLLDTDQKIIKIINNYEHINFNFGPTLLSWLEKHDKDTYQAILDADKASIEAHNGHGNAIAQVHSHLIMPLCNARDKETQVKWGLRDFESRFGRKAEGIWLAETAANIETLEVLAANDIKYTILAPRQAKALKHVNEQNWQQIKNEAFDTRIPYLCRLPSGKTISLFFYNGNIAQDVAFKGLLNNGKAFANSFLSAFDDTDEAQLVHIATDGESYGHHHRYGEMALADALNYIKDHSFAKLTNYGEYLEMFPPQYEIQIHDNSSWSCVHGVERWRSNCGCNSGGHGNWNQEWRSHLRHLLNWLRDELNPIFEKQAGLLLKDPWEARNEYIHVLLNRDPDYVNAFLNKHCVLKPSKKQKTQLLRLLEMQRNVMLMFTSCGWFFDEISGIETNQILQYALRAIAYAKQTADKDFHPAFLDILRLAPSNVFENGATSYEKNVIPAELGLTRVGMHYAVASLFAEYPEYLEFFNYSAKSELFERLEAGNMKVAIGRTILKSKITHSEKHFSSAVLYMGQQNIIGNISVDMDKFTFDKMHKELTRAFRTTNLGDAINIMQRYFKEDTFTIWHLFLDEKRKILRQISKESMARSEAAFRDIYHDNYQLMTGMLQSNIPVPSAFKSAAQYIINTDLHRFFLKDDLDMDEFQHLVSELEKWDFGINNEQSFKLAASERIFYEIKKIAAGSYTVEQLIQLNDIFSLLNQLESKLDIWKSQNLYVSMANDKVINSTTPSSGAWWEAFVELGEYLNVKTLVASPVG